MKRESNRYGTWKSRIMGGRRIRTIKRRRKRTEGKERK